jgi:maleamate amidohydrolase
MTDEFENHSWMDAVAPDVIEVYKQYHRDIYVGPSPALVAINLYELAYQGGARPPVELRKAG